MTFFYHFDACHTIKYGRDALAPFISVCLNKNNADQREVIY